MAAQIANDRTTNREQQRQQRQQQQQHEHKFLAVACHRRSAQHVSAQNGTNKLTSQTTIAREHLQK
eukprot:2834952-Amphidinium_carterae.1